MTNKKDTREVVGYMGASAVVMGYLKRERGQIPTSAFNKLIKELGYEGMHLKEMQTVASDINNDKALSYLYDLAVKGEISLDVIQPPGKEDKVLTEKDVFPMVTPYITEKENNTANLREFRKMQRDGTAMKLLFDSLKTELIEELKDLPKSKYITSVKKAPQQGDKSLILCFSDWHVGMYVINESTGGYNFDMLTQYVDNIVAEVLKMVKEQNIKHLYVYNLGDITEHINMRNVNQAFDAEMHLSKQIATSTRLTVDVLSKLSKHLHVTYTQIAGNHDRMQVSKNDVISGDSTAYVLLSTLIMLQEDLGQLPNVTVVDNRESMYAHTQDIAGLTVKAVHGDKEKKGLHNVIGKHVKTKNIDLIIMGHFHSTLIQQEDYARYKVVVGSPQGENDFSKDNNMSSSYGSQMIIVLEEGRKSPVFYPLMLKEGEII
ncbi:DNA polymerase I [Bacillus phage Juglone]|uniref:DNA polymerase I n=1 Tax=Bacillus phage Juglone TaxID=1805949 RepID=A0A143FIN1_9CAUD|nr:DNA polymerase I [Bacillus phage Juglone]